MRIAILNDLFLTEAQLARLRGVGGLTICPDTTDHVQALARIQRVEIAVVDGFKLPVTRTLMQAGADLRLIVLTSTAFHMADLAAAKARGIRIANIPGYATEAVAEHAIALLFAVVRTIVRSDRAMREQPFEIDPANPGHQAFLGSELRGKSLGVIGLGAIGRRVAELGAGLGMKVLGYNRTPRPLIQVRGVSLDELLRLSDVVSLNLAVHPDTQGIISDRELKLMKPGAVLINTAAWELVDAPALYRALLERRLGGAGLDVSNAQHTEDPVFALETVVLTPQSAAWTREACANLAEGIVATIEAFARNEPINIVC